MVFIIAGVHQNPMPLGDRFQVCPYCYRPANLHYMAVRKALHIFWIPLFPLPTSTNIKCPLCGKMWQPNDAPVDHMSYLYIAISIALLTFGLIIWIYSSICWTILPFLIANFALSLGTLSICPSSHQDYPPTPSQPPVINSRPIPSGAVPYGQAQGGSTYNPSPWVSHGPPPPRPSFQRGPQAACSR